MDLTKLEELLKKISFTMLEYEEGDMMLLSDLIDELALLEGLATDYESIKSIGNIIAGVCCVCLQGGRIDNITDIFSQGIDIIYKIVKKINNTGAEDGEINSLFKNEINDFFMDYSRYAEDCKKSKEFANKVKETVKPGSFIQVNSEALKIFLVEAEERIINAQEMVLNLEDDPQNPDLLNNLFRIFHTIKGECGFLRLSSLAELSHNVETLLDLLRNKKIEYDMVVIELLLAGIDFAKQMMSALSGGDFDTYNEVDISSYLSKIRKYTQEQVLAIGEILEQDGKLSGIEVENVLKKQKDGFYTKKFGEIALEEQLISNEELLISLEKQGKDPGEILDNKSDPIIKVKASQINFLVDMIGELMISENQLDETDRNVIQLKKITKELQNAAMKLRTTKVKNLFLKMKRHVRDVSKKLGKMIKIGIEGVNLEIDRNLVESLEEPLIHIIRNAVHHGIEDSETRKASGKEEAGNILIKGERLGNHIQISITDDGKGLDRDKILKKAIEQKLITPEEGDSLPDKDVFELIFYQGLSTAEQIDYVSGRGVGMDIVKSTVMQHRGKVDIKTERGYYTTISMIFPLSTAIIDGMIVIRNDVSYIIPVLNIIESMEIQKNLIHHVKNKTRVINLRGDVIPIIDIDQFFDVAGEDKKNGEKTIGRKRELGVVVENNEKQKFVFIVDQILAKKEVVIKSLGNKFKNLKGIASGAILQGGKIGFVLDVEQLVTLTD